MQRRARYLYIFGVTITIVVIFVGAINVIVDPYGTFRIFDVGRWNRIKPYPDHNIAIIKRQAMRHVLPDALILGNSRAEVGFDPFHPAWKQRGFLSVYNAAVPGAGPDTAWHQLQYASNLRKPGMILLGLEFFDFLIPHDDRSEPISDLENSWRTELGWGIRATLTTQAGIDSLMTVFAQFKKNPAQLSDRGLNPLHEYNDHARIDGYYKLFRQRAEENVKNHGRRPANLYLQGTRSSKRFDQYRKIVRWAVQNDVELQIIVYPYHAQLLLILDELGLWPVFDEWKRQIIHIAEMETTGHGQTKVAVTDFSGFSTFAQEPIPIQGDRKSILKWYWEAGHFKKELGDLVLTQTLIPKGANAEADFGVRLETKSMNKHLQNLLVSKTTYRNENPKMVEEVVELVKAHKSVLHH